MNCEQVPLSLPVFAAILSLVFRDLSTIVFDIRL